MRRRGFTFVEMIGVLVVLAVVALVGGRTLWAVARVIREVPAAEDARRTEERAIEALRADAWGEKAEAGPGGVRLGGAVWAVGADGVLSRTAAGETVAYRGLKVTLATRPSGMIVAVGPREYAVASEAGAGGAP